MVGALCAVVALCLLFAAPGRRRLAGAARQEGLLRASATPATPPTSASSRSVLHKHPALIECFRTWGSDFPESIERWQEARARPILHITTADNNDGHELISPRGDRHRRRRRVPDPPQQALLGEEDARLHPAAGRAQPLPQRLRRLRLRGQCPRRRPQHPLVQTRLPPHLRDRPRRRQARARSTPACARPGCRRCSSDVAGPAQGAGRSDLEHAAGRLADRPPEPPPPLLPRPTLGRLGRAPTSTPTTRTGRRSTASTGASPASPSRSPSGASTPATTRLRAQADDLGRAPPPHQDARLLPGLRLDQLLPDPELAGQPRRAAQHDPQRPLPLLRALPAEGAAAAAGRGRRPEALTSALHRTPTRLDAGRGQRARIRFASPRLYLNGCRAVMLE